MDEIIKLRDYAKMHKVCYMTAHRWFHAGLIEGSFTTPAGSNFVKIKHESPLTKNENNSELIVIYCRVSNQSRKNELEYQVNRCMEFATANSYTNVKVYKEVASGMNDNRRELWKMLNSNPTTIIVENKDRLTRTGFRYISELLKHKCKIVVINTVDDDEQDLMRDMISIVTSFCCRLYGLRRTKNKLNKLKALLNDQE